MNRRLVSIYLMFLLSFILSVMAASAAVVLNKGETKIMSGGCSFACRTCSIHGCTCMGMWDSCVTEGVNPCTRVENGGLEYSFCSTSLAEPGDTCSYNYYSKGCGKLYKRGTCPVAWVGPCEGGTEDGSTADRIKATGTNCF